jgi:hypothetical protein
MKAKSDNGAVSVLITSSADFAGEDGDAGRGRVKRRPVRGTKGELMSRQSQIDDAYRSLDRLKLPSVGPISIVCSFLGVNIVLIAGAQFDRVVA